MNRYGDAVLSNPIRILPGYSSSSEAIDRLEKNGEPTEALDRLVALVTDGSLVVTAIEQNGNKRLVAPRFWRFRQEILRGILWEERVPSNFYSKMMTFQSTMPMDWRPAFLTKDLDEKLPLRHRIERENASSHAASMSETDTISEGSPVDPLIPINNEGRIRNATMAVYACAERQNTAIPNNREMYKPVSELLALEGRSALSTRVEAIARQVRKEQDGPGGKYRRLLCGRGETPAKKGLKPWSELKV